MSTVGLRTGEFLLVICHRGLVDKQSGALSGIDKGVRWGGVGGEAESSSEKVVDSSKSGFLHYAPTVQTFDIKTITRRPVTNIYGPERL